MSRMDIGIGKSTSKIFFSFFFKHSHRKQNRKSHERKRIKTVVNLILLLFAGRRNQQEELRESEWKFLEGNSQQKTLLPP